MIEIGRYLTEIKTRLALSNCIAQVEVVTERAIQDHGYFRARLRLSNGDFLEVSEYFIVRGSQLETVEYRYQWMDPAQKQLIRRWDNARHFPELPHFPHHVHVGEENQVVPGHVLSISGLIDLIEQELGFKHP